MAFLREKSLKFDGVNYDNWEKMMKTHLLCMGLGYWLITKSKKIVIEEKDLETCDEAQKDLFMLNMLAREALL